MISIKTMLITLLDNNNNNDTLIKICCSLSTILRYCTIQILDQILLTCSISDMGSLACGNDKDRKAFEVISLSLLSLDLLDFSEVF